MRWGDCSVGNVCAKAMHTTAAILLLSRNRVNCFSLLLFFATLVFRYSCFSLLLFFATLVFRYSVFATRSSAFRRSTSRGLILGNVNIGNRHCRLVVWQDFLARCVFDAFSTRRLLGEVAWLASQPDHGNLNARVPLIRTGRTELRALVIRSQPLGFSRKDAERARESLGRSLNPFTASQTSAICTVSVHPVLHPLSRSEVAEVAAIP